MTELNMPNPHPFPSASILGYPRIGRRRELKKAVEAYWAGKIDAAALDAAAKEIQLGTAKRLQGLGLTEAAAVPGTFSYYDQVLDAAAHLGAVPARFGNLLNAEGQLDIDGYFTLARGNKDQQPLEMTKWFDTNYHYLVPEIGPETNFALTSNRIVEEFEYALANGVETRPYIVGPVTFLLLSKASDDAPAGFSPLSRLEDVLPVYTALLQKLRRRRRQLGPARRARPRGGPGHPGRGNPGRRRPLLRGPRRRGPAPAAVRLHPVRRAQRPARHPRRHRHRRPAPGRLQGRGSRPPRPWPRWATRPSSPASWTATTSGATISPPPRRRSPN